MGILEGKRVLITGVLNTSSIAYASAQVAQAEGAEIVLSGFGRGLSITERVAKKLGDSVPVIELDVSNPDQLEAAAQYIGDRWGALDGLLHSIGYAPPACLEGDILHPQWSDVSIAIEISAYSLKSLTQAMLPLLRKGSDSSVVGLDFDAQVAWPGYNWMGVAKAALESLSRYLARDLGPDGIRVNLVSAGPIKTIAARSVESFGGFQDLWGQKAPLGWDPSNAIPVARAVAALLSSWFPMTTGEIIHVDGGFHAVGA
ncbi:MAG: enoyl-ACP reductase FabI [Acidimicrobiales bacterium]